MNPVISREYVEKNYIHKDKIKDIFRKAQDYDLSYKDTVLFNLIMQEIEGQNKWYGLEETEDENNNTFTMQKQEEQSTDSNKQ